MRASLSSVVALALFASACSHTQAFVISGESLNNVGEQFLAVADYMDTAAKEGKVSEEQYKKWTDFGTKFINIYPAAAHLWKMATLLDDPKLKDQAIGMLMTLIPELLNIAQDFGLTLDVFK